MDRSRQHSRASRAHEARRRWTTYALAIIGFGAALRLAIALRAGVGYDEVFVIGVGLDELAGGVGRWLFEVPVRRSDAVTPLWWWLQAVPAVLVGHVTLWGIRCLPVALGCLSLGGFWLLARRRVGRGPALISMTMAAVCDVAAFVSARGEFAEPLLMLAALPAVCLVGDARRPVAKGALWFVLLFTHLGKGAFVVAGLVLAEVLYGLLRAVGRSAGADRRRAARLALSASIAIAPTLLWLVFSNQRVFAGGAVETDTGARSSIWQAIAAITFHYTQTKSHMISGPWDALQVYLDGWVWPTTTILTVPMLIGVIAAAVNAVMGGAATRRGAMVVSLMPIVLVGGALVIGRGLIGGRFHLLYLPAVWVIAGIGLWRLRGVGHAARIALGMLWAAHLALSLSWTSWYERSWSVSLLVAVAALFPLALAISSIRSIRAACALGLVGLAAAAAWAGPARWGPAARFEPLAKRPDDGSETLLAAIDRARAGLAPYPNPHGRTLHLDLANYYLTKPSGTAPDFERAISHSLLATRYDDDKARAWVYVGLSLRRAGRPKEEVRAAWERSYAIRPEPRVAAMIAELGD